MPRVPWWQWVLTVSAVALLSGVLFSDPRMLHGDLIYDDSATVSRNPVVLGLTPWVELWRRDFWGQYALTDPMSHKSFRPLTSLTLRLNYADSVSRRPDKTISEVDTFGFHVLNVALHVAVSALCVPVVFVAFGGAFGGAQQWSKRGRRGNGSEGVGARENAAAAAMAALLFSAHPVHSEAVQNITGRAEPLMALFYLLGFLVFAAGVTVDKGVGGGGSGSGGGGAFHVGGVGGGGSAAGDGLSETFVASSPRYQRHWWGSKRQTVALVGTMTCTVLSLLSKEMGITLPMLCCWWDFFVNLELALSDLVVDPRIALSPPSERGSVSGVSGRIPAAAVGVVRRRLVRVWLGRTAFLGLCMVGACWGRASLNGGSPPMFRYNANRHAIEPYSSTGGPRVLSAEAELVGLEEAELSSEPELGLYVGGDSGVHGLRRKLSVAWLWVRYLWHGCVCPCVLCADWSGNAVPLVRDPSRDPRVLVLFLAAVAVLALLCRGGGVASPFKVATTTTTMPSASGDRSGSGGSSGGSSSSSSSSSSSDGNDGGGVGNDDDDEGSAALTNASRTLPRVMACIAFYAFPFLLSSNVFLVVGTTVAERVAYLPSLGVCMAFSLAFVTLGNKIKGFGEVADDGGGSGGGGNVDDDGSLANDENAAAGCLPSSSSFQRWGAGRFVARRFPLSWFLCACVTCLFATKCWRRNLEWTSPRALWGSAYAVNPHSAHTCQNFAVTLMTTPAQPPQPHSEQNVEGGSSGGSDGGSSDESWQQQQQQRRKDLELAAQVLDSVRSFAEVDRVDTDEVYTTLALTLRLLNRWHEALEVATEGWGRMEERGAALDRGVKIWHMHELKPDIENVAMRKGRLLAAHATTLAHVDLAEACKGMVAALQFAPDDSVVGNMASDLESYTRNAFMAGLHDAAPPPSQHQHQPEKQQSAPQVPHQTILYQRYMSGLVPARRAAEDFQ